MSVLSVDFDKTNLDDDDTFYKCNLKSINHVRLLAWRNKFEKEKVSKKIYKPRINAYSVASNKMLEVMHVRR